MDGAARTDGQLLTSFVQDRDTAALAALVRRHGPMVWGVCSRMLRSPHDAEDAFQASFLVLVQKAPTLTDRELVGNWLYGVAHQTAVRMRALAARRGAREKQVEVMPEATSPEQYVWNDLKAVLDEELACLPDKYRAAIVLCDLEGKTRKVAARQLAIPEGTVASRLAAARAMLAKRLSRRGIILSGALLGSVLSSQATSAGVPMTVVSTTIQSAKLFAAGQAATAVASPTVAALMEGVVKTMVVSKIKSVLAVVLVVAALAGAGLIYQTQAAEQTAKLAVKVDQPRDMEPPAQPKPQPAKTDEARLVGWWTIVNDDSNRRKGELWEIGTHQIVMNADLAGFRIITHFHRLDSAKSPKQIDITVTAIAGIYGAEVPIKPDARIIGVIKGIYELKPGELRLCLGEMGKDRPAAFPEKRKPGEVLILHGGPELKADAGESRKTVPVALVPDRPPPPEPLLSREEKLRRLIDEALTAHGGEDRLKKLQFTMTVKHSNGYANQYFVRPPKNFRWEYQQRDHAVKTIVITFPNGRRWWNKDANGDPKEFIPLGAELRMDAQLDRIKFFGPREVLRLKDADHKVALLDGVVKIGDRAAVGVEVTGKHFNRRMYFDKETHLLVKIGTVTYSDYKKFDGIPVAQKENDGNFMPEITEFRVMEKFADKLFEQP
jgi:RNA polymerase sigma factor (sigma-70 family)